jgi:predicted ArsR family transcriptional regulator
MWDMSRPGPDPDVNDEELVWVLGHREQPYATAGDVSEDVPLSETRTKQRLDRLADEGDIESGAVGERQTIYWLES